MSSNLRISCIYLEAVDLELIVVQAHVNALEDVPQWEIRSHEDTCTHVEVAVDVPLPEIFSQASVKLEADVLSLEILFRHP